MDSAAVLRELADAYYAHECDSRRALLSGAAALEREQRPSSYAAVTPQTAAVGGLVQLVREFTNADDIVMFDDGLDEWYCPLCSNRERAVYKPAGKLRPHSTPYEHSSDCDIVHMRAALAALTNQAREVKSQCPRCKSSRRWRKWHECLEVADPWHDSQPAAVREGKAPLDRAVRALERAGFTLTTVADEWKPPLGPNAGPLLAEIDSLRARVAELERALTIATDGKVQWLDSNASDRQIATLREALRLRGEEVHAFAWAIGQSHQSVAARHARTLGQVITRALEAARALDDVKMSPLGEPLCSTCGHIPTLCVCAPPAAACPRCGTDDPFKCAAGGREPHQWHLTNPDPDAELCACGHVHTESGCMTYGCKCPGLLVRISDEQPAAACERCDGEREIGMNIPATEENPVERDVMIPCPECTEEEPAK